MKNPVFFFLINCSFIYAQSGLTIIDSIFSNGMYRSYRLYVPSNYTGSTSVPLIINLHGYTSNAIQQQLYSNFMPIADTAGFLMVYPQGKVDPYGNPFWNAGIVSTSIVNDTLFLNQLIDSLKLNYNIDLSRVYMTGLSNGGFMSHYMACFCNRKITAIASVAGTFFTFWPNCNPGKIIPVMHIHGTADPTVPYYGNSSMTGADTTVGRWVLKNNCNPVASHSLVPDINTTDGSTAEDYRYFITANNKPIVELFKVNNGGHTWPGSPYIIGPTNQDINASAEIWRFFRQFSLTDFTMNVTKHKEPDKEFFVYPNPITHYLFIYSNTDIHSVEIFDLSNKKVWSSEYKNGKEQFLKIDINTLERGIYFLKINQHTVKKIVKE